MMFIRRFLLFIVATGFFVPFASAQVKPDITATNPTPLEQRARKIYERLSGTKIPIDHPKIKTMVALLEQGDLMGASQVATSDPNFYNITVKLMALEMSTREETIKTPFNDFTAAFIGITRDGIDARQLLTGNFYYVGQAAGISSGLVPDILMTNRHYEELEEKRVDLSSSLVMMTEQQIATSATESVASPDPAGVLTSRTFMAAHADMGTNRRLLEYTFREFMCVPLSEWADTGASDARIGRDIDRFPAGDHMKFQSSCKGCHTVMDGFRGAFAKWDYNGKGVKHSAVNERGGGDFRISADSRGIATKMNHNNDVFPSGYVTVDDSFVNNAVRPANAALFEWRGDASGGKGVKDFGTIVANSRRFSQCMVKRVFKAVCRKDLDFASNKDNFRLWGNEFEASGYQLKTLFESVATKPECLGS